MGSIPQAVVVEEAVHAFATSTSTDGIGHVVLVGAKELSQTTAVELCIGVDAV